MVRVVLLQFVLALVVTMVAALFGERVALSSFLGGMCSVLPTMLFAIGLEFSDRKLRSTTLGAFLLWEVVKIATTIASLVIVFWLYKDVEWLSLLVSFAISLKSYIFLLSRFKT